MKGLSGKVVIVTGGAGGIGAAICHRLAQEGANIAIFDLNIAAAQAVVADILNQNIGQAHEYKVDITDAQEVQATVLAVEQKQGPIDVLINNAGWDHGARFLDTDPTLWQKIIAINLLGPLNLHKSVLKLMSARGKGRVINIASDAGRVGSSGEAVYSACKGGMIAFTKTMAREMARKQININVVCPGPTDTALFRDFAGEGESADKLKAALTKAIPFGRLGQPDDLAGAVCFLASDDAAFITGQVLSVSGGLTMAG